MTNRTLPTRPVKSAAHWPAWTDSDQWTTTEDADVFHPSPEDDDYAARELGHGHDDEPDDAEWDRLACEADAVAMSELGLRAY